jgi:hypothetical protein
MLTGVNFGCHLIIAAALFLFHTTITYAAQNEKTDYLVDQLAEFSDGAAAFKKDGRWGFIDSTGKPFIQRPLKKLHVQGRLRTCQA